LQKCATDGDVPRVDALIRAKTNAARPDAWNSRALHVAVHLGHVEVVRALLDVGAFALDSFFWAVQCDNTEIMRVLMDPNATPHPARADSSDHHALFLAAKYGCLDALRALLDAPLHAARADARDSVALLSACIAGHLEIVRALLDAPRHAARANAQDSAALRSACADGHLEIVRALLDTPPMPGAAHTAVNLRRALARAHIHQHADVEDLLEHALDDGAYPPRRGDET
jgi:ankyrin repeat protein